MKSPFKYLVVNPLLALLLVVLLLLVTVGLLAITQTGTNILVKSAERFLPVLSVESVRGTLVDEVTADSLVWENNGIKVDVQDAVFEPGVRLGFPLDIEVKQLTAQRLVIDLPPTEDTPYVPFSLPDLRVSAVNARLDNVAVDELVINQGETVIKIHDVVLKAYTEEGKFYLTRLNGTLGGDFEAVSVSAEGEMGLNVPHALQLSAALNSSSELVGRGELVLEAGGELLNYQANLSGNWTYADFPAYALNARGRGSFEGVLLDTVSLVGDGGNADLSGELQWSPFLKWNLQGAAENIKPEYFDEAMKGVVNLTLTSSGNLEGDPGASLQLTKLEGELRGLPLKAELEAEVKDNGLLLSKFEALLGDNHLAASGEANKDSAINWRLDAPRLDQLHPDISGALVGDGALSGTVDGSVFQLAINELNGQVMDYSVDAKGDLSLVDGLVTAKALQVDVGDNLLKMDGVANEEQGIDWVLVGDDLSQLHPELSGQLQGRGNAKGLLDGSKVALQIDELEGKVKDYPLMAEGFVRLEGQSVSAKNLQLEVGGNRLRLDGDASADAGLDLQIDAPDLAALHKDFPGHLKGRGNAKGLPDGSRLALQIDELAGEVRGSPVKAAGGVHIEGEKLSAQDLKINVGENLLSLNGQANDEGVKWLLDAPALAALHPDLAGSLKGQGNATGLLDGSRVALHINGLGGVVNGYPVQAQGLLRMQHERLFADNFRVNAGKNKISLNGEMDEGDGINWAVDAPELVTFHPQLGGHLAGKGSVKGRLGSSRLSVSINALEGEVQGYPVQASGGVRLDSQRLFAEDLKLTMGKNRVTLNGQADNDQGINWQIDAPELAAFSPELRGSLIAKGNAKGLPDGSYLAVNINRLSGEVQGYSLEAGGGVHLKDGRLFADQLKLNIGKNQVALNGEAGGGDGINWQLDAPELASISPQLVGRLKGRGNLKGELDGSRLAVDIESLSGRVQGYPLAAVGGLRFEDKQLFADKLQFNTGKNHIVLDGQVDEKQGIGWQLSASELASISPQLAGQLKGQGNAKVALDGSRVAVGITGLSGKVNGYPVVAAGAVRLQGEQLFADSLKLDVGKNRISLVGQLDEVRGIDWQLDAPQLAAFSPRLNGSLKGGGSVKGRLDGSRLAVSIKKLDGQVQGYPVSAVGAVRFEDERLFADALKLTVGGNQISLNGEANESTGIIWRIDAPKLVAFHPELNGHLKGNGAVKGVLDGSRLSVQVARLGGRVNGFPVNAQGGISFNNKVWAANDLNVSMGQNAIRMNGVVDEGRGINWSLNAPQLVQIDPALQGSLKGNGKITGALDGSKLNVRVDQLNGRVMGYPLAVAGGVQLRGQQLAANKLMVNVGANAIRFDGAINTPTGIGWSLNAQKLVQLSPALDGQLKGRGNIKGGLDTALMTLNVADLSGRIKGFPVKAVGTVHLRDKQYVVANNLRVNVGANALQLNGQLDEAKGISWQLDAKKLVQLSPELDGQLRGGGTIKGALDGSRFAVRVNALQGRVRQYPVSISGEVGVNGKDFAARNVMLNSGQNTVRLNGNIGSSVGLNWQIDARNVAQIVPGVKASVKGHGTLSGQLDEPNLNVQIARLSGQVDGNPLSAKGTASIQGKKINVSNLQVVAGNNSLALYGQVSEPMDLSWKVDARNLAQAGPGLAGGLQGQGTVSGSYKLPQLKGFLKGANVRYQDFSVQAVDVNITQKGANYNVRGVLRNLKQGENVLSHVEVKGQGTVERHAGTLVAVSKDGKLNATVSGGLNNGQWKGGINTLALRETVAGDWQLTAPVKIDASAQAVTVSNSCLANRQNARFCTQQTSWTKSAGLVAKGQLHQVPLAMARPFLPSNIQLPGRLNADYQFEQRGGRPSARINVQLPDSTVAMVSKRGRKDNFRYTNARASVVLNNRTATIDAQLDVVGHGQMRAQGQVVLSPANNQHQIDLRTTVNMPSITWLQRLSPQVDALKGSVNGDVRVVGLLTKPQVTGALRLSNGSLYLPETGSRLSDISLAVQANRADQLTITGTLRAGSGQLTASGNLRLAKLPNWSADLRLQGTDLLLMNSYEVQAKVSPDLVIKASPQSVAISGTVKVPETTVSLRELPTSANVRSDDIVIVGSGRPKPNKVVVAPDSGSPLYIQPNVNIVLGDRVHFNGFGLGARLAGRLRILRNRQDIMAEGVLRVIDGVYKAYGQNLKIGRGRLLFNGPIDNPGLDVRATREVEDGITVGIAVGGSVNSPESRLFSDPVQTQTDTLSYLLTGHALSGVKGAESAILNQAVTSLGVSGGESLAQQLGGQLGLDDVGLSAQGGDYKQSELSLGKRLGPKLYVKYIVGLFDSLQKIAVTYQINKKLQLEATSGVQQSVDLIYKIDTNRGPFGN